MNFYKLPVYVCILLRKDNQVLLIERCNTGWGDGLWNLPGGSLDAHESLHEAVIRESREELAVELDPEHIQLIHVIHSKRPEKDVLGFYFVTDRWQGIPVNNEPDKHSAIAWYDLDKLPENLTLYSHTALNGYKQGTFYSALGWK